jgi:hypothetical protein
MAMKKDAPPAENREAKGRPAISSARARTLDRKQSLIGLAALGVAACSSKSGSDLGYGVVDPMPAPARCAGGASSIHGSAAFELGADGKRGLVIRLAPPTDSTTTFVPADEGDTTFRLEAGGLEARVVPTADATSYAFRFSIQCGEGRGYAEANVSWPSPDVPPGTPLTVSVASTN